MASPDRPQIGTERVTAADRFIYWFTRHWLAVFNALVLLYVGLPFVAPVLMHYGAAGPAEVIYKVYYPVCHQLPYRSWFLFGPQATYSRAQFEGLTGIDTLTGAGQLDAKNFLGNASMGFKVAFCQRDVAIYLGLLGGALIFGLVRERVRPISWVLWFIIGVVPIGLDGFSQLFSQLPTFGFMANPLWNPANPFWRESTPLLRSLTGGLFGFMLVWLSYPYVEESMLDMRRQLQKRFAWPK